MVYFSTAISELSNICILCFPLLPIMPYRKISRDLKLAAIRLYEGDILELHDILDCLRISQRTFLRIWKLWNETGDIVNRNIGARGRPQIFAYEDIKYLCRVIHHRPDWFLDELDFLLCTNRFIAAHYTTIHWELLRAGITPKKLKKVASEPNENIHVDFIRCMAPYNPEQLSFLDEMLKDECITGRRRGQLRKGTRAVQKGGFCERKKVFCRGVTNSGGNGFKHGCRGVYDKGNVSGIFGALHRMPYSYFTGV